MIMWIVFLGLMVYVVLLCLSFAYSCGGWSKECGLCWVGVVQAPLVLVDKMLDCLRGCKKREKR
jgi:hypothetical protein